MIDPQGPATGEARVFRGGGWNDNGGNCRTAFRGYYYGDPSLGRRMSGSVLFWHRAAPRRQLALAHLAHLARPSVAQPSSRPHAIVLTKASVRAFGIRNSAFGICPAVGLGFIFLPRNFFAFFRFGRKMEARQGAGGGQENG